MNSDSLEFSDNFHHPGPFLLDGSLMSDVLNSDINMSNYDFLNPTAADTAATNLSALFHSDLAQNDGDNADSQIRVSASFSTMQVSDVMLTAANSQSYLIPRQDSVPASQSSMVVISAQPSPATGQTGQIIHMSALNPVSTVSLPVSNSTQPQPIMARTGLSPSQMSPILLERLQTSVHVMRSMPSTNGHMQRANAPDPRSDVKNEYPKPQFSYSCLIALALKNSESGSLPVRDIYKFMMTHFPYYKTARDGWKNSVRHNLSMNKCFEKLGDPTRATGSKKGSHWRMIPAKRPKMEEEINKSKNKDMDGLRRSMAYPEQLELIEQGRAGIPRDRVGPIVRQPRTPSSCSNSSAGSGQVESPPAIPENMETILESELFNISDMSDVANWMESNQNEVLEMLNSDDSPPSPTQVMGLGSSQGSQGPMSPMTLSQFTVPSSLNIQIQPHEGSDSPSSAGVLSGSLPPSPGGFMTSSYPPSPSALLNGNQLSPLGFGQQSPLGGILGRGAPSPLGLGNRSSSRNHHIFDFIDMAHPPHSPQMAMRPPSRPSSQGTLPP